MIKTAHRAEQKKRTAQAHIGMGKEVAHAHVWANIKRLLLQVRVPAKKGLDLNVDWK